MKIPTAVDLFLRQYGKGELPVAIRTLLNEESLEFSSPLGKAVVNLALVFCFQVYGEAYLPLQALKEVLEEDPLLFITYEETLEQIEFDLCWVENASKDPERYEREYETYGLGVEQGIDTLLRSERWGVLFSEREKEKVIASVPLRFQKQCALWLEQSQSLMRWVKENRDLSVVLGLTSMGETNLLPLAKPYVSLPTLQRPRESASLFFLERMDEDVKKGGPSLCIFPDSLALAASPLPDCPVLTLDSYPIEPLLLQKIRPLEEPLDFCCLLPGGRRNAHEYLQQLQECLHALPQYPWQETEEADRLYALGKRWQQEIRAERLGPSRWGRERQRVFWQERKALQRKPFFPFPWSTPVPSVSRRKNKAKKVAHIVATVQDGAFHAPTQRLKLLLQSYAASHFEPHLFLTESHRLRLYDYPVGYGLEPSKVIGEETLREWNQQGLPLWVETEGKEEQGAVEALCRELSARSIDIALFHEDFTMHLLAAQQCDVPYKVYMEHGTLPPQGIFDALILSNAEEAQRWKNFYGGVPLLVNEKAIEAKKCSPRSLGFSPQAKILGTVSNSLDARLSYGMCEAVATILQRVPEAHYFVIGNIERAVEKEKIFSQYRVAHRVHFWGAEKEVQDFLPSFDVYLNEFPHGGSSSILEAMSVGCPVVALFLDDQGPPARREGAHLFGMEKAVHSVGEYVETTCRLLCDEAFKKEWQEYTRARFAQRPTAKHYGERHQEILESLCLQGCC